MDSLPRLVHAPSSTPDPALHCVLVHGTFAPDAAWVQPDSFLAKELLQIDPGGVAISKFLWSGANTHSERVDAAKALSRNLADLAAKFPRTRILLVCHSHGGNVAMNATSSIPEHQRAGIVCLGTPFFHVSRRSTRMLYFVYAGLFAIAAGILWGGMFWALTIVIESKPLEFWRQINGWIYSKVPLLETMARVYGSLFGGFMALLTLVGGAVGALFVGQGGPPKGQLRAEARWQALSPQHVKTLCIWFAPDEAFWILRSLRQFGEWVHNLASIFSRFIIPVGVLGAVIAAGWLGWTHGMEVRGEDSKAHAGFAAMMVALYAGGAMVAIPMALWSFAHLISTVTKRGIGTVQAMDHLWLDIRTERVPQIDPSLVDLRPLPLPGGSLFENFVALLEVFRGYLVHSRAYGDERTPREIARWYRDHSPHNLRTAKTSR